MIYALERNLGDPSLVLVLVGDFEMEEGHYEVDMHHQEFSWVADRYHLGLDEMD